jgi:hypothetical protein
MKILLQGGAEINAHMVTEPRRAAAALAGGDGAAARAQAAVGAGGGGRGGRGSQMPSAFVVPHQTALHGAAEHGFNDFVKFLVENGADLQAKDADGRTPLDLAKGVRGGRGQADSFPETVALLESLMKAKGIPVSSSK